MNDNEYKNNILRGERGGRDGHGRRERSKQNNLGAKKPSEKNQIRKQKLIVLI